jgi:hypothetical protein
MKNSIYQYFILNGRIVLPGIGTLQLQRQKAVFLSNGYIAPKEKVVFISNEATPSPEFYDFIANQLDVSLEEATVQFHDYINDFIGQTSASLPIGNIGTFHKNYAHIQWVGFFNEVPFYKDFSPNAAIDSIEATLKADEPKKDFSIIWYIILFVIATVLILIKYV